MASLNRRSAPAGGESIPQIHGGDKSKDAGGKPASSMLRPTARTWGADQDIQRRWSTSSVQEAGRWLPFLALSFQAIGVVYGDIGTSFIYVFPAVFEETPTAEDVIGAVSLVVWTITALVLIKYALIVLRADDNGQGGTFALFSLLKRQAELGEKSANVDSKLSQYSSNKRRSSGRSISSGGKGSGGETRRQGFIENGWTQTIIRVLVVFGVGAIMGDGVLTPSVSIVSACEGINVKWPNVTRGTIDGIAVGIVVVLFALQRFGTHFVGFMFSPVITIWLLANAGIGAYNIATFRPEIFVALSPHKWFQYFLRTGHSGWRSLGGVLLCVTGCEALFADMGHFSRRSIQVSFSFLAWPCLILTYLGQAAYLTKHPDQFSTSFWSALPDGSFYPMWILATLASIIASQALISAAFQIIKQAISQGFFPRFTVIHTSKKHKGQIYIPFICYVLGGLCIILILTFKTSAQLTKAYGLAVIIDMLLTTHFLTLVMITVWKLPLIFPIAFYLCYAAIEGTFLSATAEKVPTGGWFSLMICAIYTIIMLLWFWGSKKKSDYFIEKASNLSRLLQLRQADGSSKNSDPNNSIRTPLIMMNGHTAVARIPGVAVYYSDIVYGAPPALEAQVTRFPSLHQINVVLTIRFVPVPEVLDHERLLMKQLPIAGFYHVIARYGYGEQVKHDEVFLDNALQQISIYLYAELRDFIHSSPQLLSTIENLPSAPREPGNPALVDEVGVPILAGAVDDSLMEKHDLDGSLPLGSSRSAVMSHGDLLKTKSAPVGSMMKRSLTKASSALHPTRSSHVAQGLTDITFQQTPSFDLTALDAQTASALSNWSQKVMSGEIKVPQGLERAEQLAREIQTLANAREHGITFVVGKTHARSTENVGMLKKYLVHEPFLFLVKNFTSDSDRAFGIPEDKLAIVGLPYPLD